MGFTTDLKESIATAMAENLYADVQLTWSTEYPYTSSDIGIYIDNQSQNANSQVVISDYAVSDDPSISDGVVGIQFLIIGTVMETDKIKDDLFDLFHGMPSGILGTVKITGVFRQSGANLGQDGSGRVSRTENYYFQTHRPSRNRT